ncbi:MAG: adenylate/guanylate cyclase domain-containing protein, partial [Alphaproteobacteria bacterium]
MDPQRTLVTARSIVAEGLRGDSEDRLLADFCERLVAGGVPLLRASLAQRTLHPVVAGHQFEWWREKGAEPRAWSTEEAVATAEGWRESPFMYMYKTGETRLRRKLVASDAPSEFPMLEEMRAQGVTDYFALITDFGGSDTVGPFEGFTSSWATDRAAGFTDGEVALIEELLPFLALAIKSSATYRVAESTLATYLGRDAGRRVLMGEIRRGSAETIRAVLWYADLKDFTRIADAAPRDQLVAMLNDYMGCMVDVVHDHGGNVLKFIGDGLLAIFRLTDEEEICATALDAAAEALTRVERLSEERATAGLPVTRFYLGLHLGDVMYGNIGSRDRLDFTVIGPAVNEVSRIEAMCRSLDRDL